MPDSRADSIDITDFRNNSSQEQDIESNVPTAGRCEPPPAIKITAYRLTVTAATISFGLAKFLLTGEGKALQANVLDFVMGVPLALLLFWLGFWEASASSKFAWYFVNDISDQIITGAVIVTTLSVTYGLPLALSVASGYFARSFVSDDLRQGYISRFIAGIIVSFVVYLGLNLLQPSVRRWGIGSRAHGNRWKWVMTLLRFPFLMVLGTVTPYLLCSRHPTPN